MKNKTCECDYTSKRLNVVRLCKQIGTFLYNHGEAYNENETDKYGMNCMRAAYYTLVACAPERFEPEWKKAIVRLDCVYWSGIHGWKSVNLQ